MKLTKTQVAKDAEYILSLTETEAGILKAMIGRITGDTHGEFVNKLYGTLIDITPAENIQFTGSFDLK